jgi:hypothetical protein
MPDTGDTGSHLAEWITAASTFLTALIAFLALRKSGLPSMPVVEPDLVWTPPQYGRFIQLRIVVRNQLYETISFDRMSIRKPRGMRFASQEFTKKDGPHGTIQIPSYEPTDERQIALDWNIAPIGETHTYFPGTPVESTQRKDVHQKDFYFSPPPSWNGGTIAVELRLLSKALTIRPRRITIKRQVAVAPKMQTDANASNQA